MESEPFLKGNFQIHIMLPIGCRLGRSWFIVKESKSDKKLLVLTKKSSECRLSLTPTTIQLLNDLFEPLSKVCLC